MDTLSFSTSTPITRKPAWAEATARGTPTYPRPTTHTFAVVDRILANETAVFSFNLSPASPLGLSCEESGRLGLASSGEVVFPSSTDLRTLPARLSFDQHCSSLR